MFLIISNNIEIVNLSFLIFFISDYNICAFLFRIVFLYFKRCFFSEFLYDILQS